MLHAHEAATAIVRLIHTKPTSPSVDEIAAIIGGPAACGAFVPTITSVGEEIDRLWKVMRTLDEGDNLQREFLKNITEPTSYTDFDGLENECRRRLAPLKDAVLGMEPQNADEALTLLALLIDGFEDFANGANDDGEEKKLTRALHALVRWLIRDQQISSLSSLVRTYIPRAALTPQCQELAEAIARAVELGAKMEEGDDEA